MIISLCSVLQLKLNVTTKMYVPFHGHLWHIWCLQHMVTAWLSKTSHRANPAHRLGSSSLQTFATMGNLAAVVVVTTCRFLQIRTHIVVGDYFNSDTRKLSELAELCSSSEHTAPHGCKHQYHVQSNAWERPTALESQQCCVLFSWQ